LCGRMREIPPEQSYRTIITVTDCYLVSFGMESFENRPLDRRDSTLWSLHLDIETEVTSTCDRKTKIRDSGEDSFCFELCSGDRSSPSAIRDSEEKLKFRMSVRHKTSPRHDVRLYIVLCCRPEGVTSLRH
jgi:hypothetical protein